MIILLVFLAIPLQSPGQSPLPQNHKAPHLESGSESKGVDVKNLVFDALQNADSAIREKNTQKALDILSHHRAWTLKYEEAAQIRLRYARLAVQMEQYPRHGIALYGRLMKRFPESVAARLALQDVRVLLNPPQWVTFLETTRIQLRQHRFSHVLEVQLAKAYHERGQADLAIGLLRRLHRLGKKTTVWHTASDLLAHYLHEEKQYREEELVLSRMIFPNFSGVGPPLSSSKLELRLSKVLCAHLSKTDHGTALLKRFEDKHPLSSLKDDALWQLAQCYEAADDMKKRSQTLCEIVQDFPHTRHARRARISLGLAIGKGPGGESVPPMETEPCPPETLSPDLGP